MLSRVLLVSGVLVLSSSAFADARSPYVGQEMRDIKALSAQDVNGYLEGKGMGYAKAAELNHYPGPRHVLDLADKLGLSQEQTTRSTALFNDMKAKASALGKQLVDKEAELDKRFASGDINSQRLQALLTEIGELTAKLRYVHLNAHLDQQALLTAQQVKHYDDLRGYGESGSTSAHQHEHGGDHQHLHSH